MRSTQQNFVLVTLFIIMANLVKGQDQVCGIGCLQCDQNLICQQCQIGFTFSQSLNQCVYQQCPLGLFYQLKDNSNFQSSQSDQTGVCQAVCDDNYYQVQQQNICINFNSCQLSYESETDVNQGQIQDVISFDEQYLLTIYDQQINQYSRSNGLFQQSLPISQNIIQIIGVNQQVYFLQSNLTLFKWNVSQNNQTIMNSIQANFSDYQNVYLVTPSNSIICSITQLKSKSQINIQHLLTISNELIPNDSQVIQITYNPLNQVQIINQFILQIQQNSIKVDEVVVDAKQQMGLSNFIQNITCSYFPSLLILMAQKSISGNYIFVLFSQYKMLYILQQSQCQVLQLEQISSKILPFMINNLDYIIVQLPNQIKFVKVISNTSEYSQIFNSIVIDMNLSQIQQQDNSFYLYVLTSNTVLNVLKIQIVNNQIQATPINQLQISINQPRKIFYLPQVSQKFFERVFVVGQDIQSFLIEKQNYSFTAEKYEYILENFSLGYDQISSSLVKLVILQNQKTIVACTTDGRLYSWDSGQIYNEIFQNYILYVISQNDYTIQTIAFQNYSIDITQISLTQNNFLIVQKNFTIEIYQLDLTNKIAQLTDKYNSVAQIQIWKVKKNFPQPQYPQYFEVYVFSQDNSFTLLKKTANSFVVFQQIQNLPLAKGLDITFIQNDPQDNYIFILGITNQQTATLPYQCLVIQKNSPSFVQFFSLSSAQSLIQPVTFKDSQNNLIYNVKVVQNLSFMSILGTQTFNSVDLSNFQDDTTILYNIQGANQLLTQDQNFIYAFDQKGFIGLNVFKTIFYQQLYSISSADFSNGDYITDVKMSYALNRYFIIRRSIYIFNINDNTFQEALQFELNSSASVNQFIILESDQVIIACKTNIIKLKNFQTNQTSTFMDSTFTIASIQIIPFLKQNMITIYGNRIIRLNLNLVNQENVSINFDPLYTIYCQFPPQNIICKLSNNQVIILEFQKLTIIQQFASKNLISSFQIQIDSLQNRLFLYTDSIEVYDLKGIFQQTVTQSSGTIINLNIYGKSLVLVTTSTLVVLDRSSLQNLGTLQGSGGGQILNVSYLEDYNHILVYTNIIRFAQVFVFSLDSLIQITSLKNQYTQNSVTIVADQIFDKYMNIYAFLDQTGSVSFIDYQGIYQQINILKIREFNSGKNPSPIGLRLCPEVNMLLVFSKNVIYVANYAQITESYKRYALKRGTFYVEINSVSQNQIENNYQFIFLGMNNGLYFYKQQQIQFLMTIKSNENILDLNFVSKNLFIIAFQSQILKYDLTSFTSNIVEGIQNINPSASKRYKFVQFLCQSVFLTLDQKLIHYNFQEDYQLNEIKLNQYQRITSYYFLQTQQILLLGFNDGTLIIYNILDMTLTKLSLQLISGITHYDDVRFILETENYIWVASLNSQVVCLSKNKIQEIIRFDFVKLMSNSSQILGVLSIDEVNSVIFMNFFREKVVRCLKLSNLQLIINLSFPDYQQNRILITKTLLIFYSTFQLNIHNRNSLKFLTSIRRQNLQDQIVSIYTFEDKYYFIASLNKFELFKVDQNSLQITLFDQVEAESFKVMKIFFNETSQFLRVIGVSNNQIFDQQYSMVFYELQQSFNQTQCSINIKDQNYIQMQNSIDLIIPIKTEQPNHLSLIEQFNSASNTFMTIYLNQQNLNEVNMQATSESQITLVPSISNQNLHDIQIQISNNDIVIIMNLMLENLNINYSSDGISFFQFISCKQISIYNLILRNVQIIGLNNSLINITNSSTVLINSTQILHSKLNQFLSTANTQNVVIQNVSIYNSSTQKVSNDDINFLFKIFGSLNLYVSSIIMYAQFYGQQYATFLQKIYISQIFSDSNSTFQELPYIFLTQNKLSLEEQALYSGKLQIQNLRSGSLLQIQLFGMDSNSDYIKFSQDLVKNGSYPDQIQQEILQYYFKIENLDKSSILLNGETLITSDQYNSTNQQFTFKEVQITSYPLKNTSLLINYQINNKQSLPILVQIQYRECLFGETVKVFSSNIISCTLCPTGSYLLSAPYISQNNSNNQYIEENSQCQKCPDSAEQCQGSQIILKDGFWRNNTNSSEIIYCENNPQNCQSKDNRSINGCIQGTIGPLCEECDTQGVVWKNKQYTRSFKEDYSCEECNSMNYQLLPQFISNCIDLVQSPVQKFAVSIDCIISSVFKDRIDRQHATQIMYLCIPLGFIILLSIIIRITERIIKINAQMTYIYTLLNFLFVFFQPSQIIFFTKSLSCRQIGSNSYQVVDLLISCSDSSYLNFSIPFSICALLVWILIPLLIFLKLRKQKEKLNFSLVRYKYGFYYSEFKPQFYYWEFIRLNIRILRNTIQFKTFQRWILIKRNINQIIANNALQNAEKATFSQLNSIKNSRGDEITNVNMNEVNNSKTGFYSQTQDEIIEYNQKSFVYGINQISPEIKGDRFIWTNDETQNQLRNTRNQIQENSSIFESKFSNISEKIRIDESSDLQDQEKLSQTIKHILPGQYNIQLHTIDQLNKKKIFQQLYEDNSN
ncbi:hypothetical protein ABPG74_007500 [Tetrahymena malaccensis]